MSGDVKELSFFGEPCFFVEVVWDLNQRLNLLLKCGLWELYYSNFYWGVLGALP